MLLRGKVQNIYFLSFFSLEIAKNFGKYNINLMRKTISVIWSRMVVILLIFERGMIAKNSNVLFIQCFLVLFSVCQWSTHFWIRGQRKMCKNCGLRNWSLRHHLIRPGTHSVTWKSRKNVFRPLMHISYQK